MKNQLEASIQARNQFRMQQVAATAGLPQQVGCGRVSFSSFLLTSYLAIPAIPHVLWSWTTARAYRS